MKHLILVLIGIWAVFQITDIVWSPKREPLSRSLARFAEPPPHHASEPYRNAYFYIIGFSASHSFQPAKVGYDMWVEARETSAGKIFDYDKPGRFDLHIPVSLRQAFPSWDADDPVTAFRGKDTSARSAADRYRVLLDRYDHCLEMPFEDWGFGQRATPRYQDMIIVHRLYIAEGFAHSTGLGIARLHKELVFWRAALRAAATITAKVAAQVVIQDDAKLLSRILSRPTVERTIVGTALQLMVPLTLSEYSLRWPIHHQVALASQRDDAGAVHEGGASDTSNGEMEWLSATAHLPLNAFKNIEHPSIRSIFPEVFGGQTADLYAAYYDALIKSSNAGNARLPKLRDIAGTIRRGTVEKLLNPAPIEPEWDIFVYQLMETDARMRLTSLQVQLRKPGATIAVPTRLAEVGSQYFDPFSGLPMLWSSTQQKLYSVGKDRLDDGGDPSFDITVPAVIASPQTVSPPRPPASAGKSL